MIQDAPQTLGKRAAKNKLRDEAVERTALDLGRAGIWPAPRTVASRSGINISVVERLPDLLLKGRRAWVRKNGRHPQWRDPDMPGASDADDPHPAETESGQPDELQRSLAKLGKTQNVVASQRARIQALETRCAELQEKYRRLLLGVRPADVSLILETGSAHDRPGKAD